jgi:Trk K+ transport system NAD-binding subunit
MLLILPAVVCVLTVLYMLGMTHLEGQPRSFGAALEFVSETITSTGYGHDSSWSHPAMIAFVILCQFGGVFLIILVVPIFLFPFIEERFEGRLATTLPKLHGDVIIYRYGPAVETLMEELTHEGVPVVIIEENADMARRLRDRGHRVVFIQLDQDDPDLSGLGQARALVANGSDEHNAVLTLNAREQGFEGPIIVLVAKPFHRKPMMQAGASIAFTPSHMLAATIAAKASSKISPRVAGVQLIGRYIEVAELRVHQGSDLAGKTLVEAGVRARTGANIIGQWVGGKLEPQPRPDVPLAPGTILVAAGSREAIARLGEIARPITQDGPIFIAGFGSVGSKVAELLTDAGEEVRVMDRVPGPGVHFTGDALDRDALERAGIAGARAVILCLGTDSTTMFASAVVRDAAPDVPIIASVAHVENIARIHRIGADFALSTSQIAGQILARQLLGEDLVSLERSLKIAKVAPGSLEGQNPIASRVRERTGCSIIAVERSDQVVVEFDQHFVFKHYDEVYICGTPAAIDAYHEVFPNSRLHMT